MTYKLIDKSNEDHAKKILVKYYEADKIPAEKKNYLSSLRNASGPYLACESGDSSHNYMLDAASQIATLGLGFSPTAFFGTSALLESWLNDKSGNEFKKVRLAFNRFIQRKMGTKEIDLLYANSGAEANETALGICYENRVHKDAKKVLAFEGSFHGRMQVSLSSTWNKSKREAFEWNDYLTVFAPFPEVKSGEIDQPFENSWRKLWESSTREEFEIPKVLYQSKLIEDEINSLLFVREQLKTRQFFSVMIEPMQCEGGDRYGSSRFFIALVLMCRSFKVPLIFDEVQTGYHLGREFFWHREFSLKDSKNNMISPDFVVCAKKAQIGVIISRYKISNTWGRDNFQVANFIRGYFHALMLDQHQHKILRLEKKSNEKLEELITRYDHFISNSRSHGVAFSFDVNQKESLPDFIKHRFDFGILYYPAGESTLRFRLNTSFSDEDLNYLFRSLDKMCAHIFLGKDPEIESRVKKTGKIRIDNYEWHQHFIRNKIQTLAGHQPELATIQNFINSQLESISNLKFLIVDSENFEIFKEQISALQKHAYEPARQTSIEHFSAAAYNQKSICIALTNNTNQIKALAVSAPIKLFPNERGTRKDPFFNDGDVLYMLDATVDNDQQGRSLGTFMKYSLTLIAQAKGISRIHGRNRDRFAASMLNINLSLGSYELDYMREDYPDNEKFCDVLYYSCPIKWTKENLSLSTATTMPLTSRSINDKLVYNFLPNIVNKVCLSNFVSESYLTDLSCWINLMPQALQHAYSTSGQSECVDKIVKSLWFNSSLNKDETPHFLSFRGHHFGQGSFLSRSLSNISDNYFPVSHLEHPTLQNSDTLCKELDKMFKSQNYLAVFIEPLTQKMQQEVPVDFLEKLHVICKKNKCALIFNETASKDFKYDQKYFTPSLKPSLTPDGSMISLGGAQGLVFLREDHFVKKPLMMISTWDGDEFALNMSTLALIKVVENKDDYLKTTQFFEEKLKTLLSRYQLESLTLKNGRGVFKGSFPESITNFFTEFNNQYIVAPSYDAMKDFLERKDI